MRADTLYTQHAGPYNFYTGYRLHDYHFVIYSAMLLGHIGPAMKAI